MKIINSVILALMLSSYSLISVQAETLTWNNYYSEAQDAHSENGRRWILRTNQPQRDNTSKYREVSEYDSDVTIKTGSSMFDALFAMSIEEMHQNKVERIHNNNFKSRQCKCFETGEKWQYVWTRDTAYAVYLGLGIMSPERSLNSLSFKTSELRSGGLPEIVQDTGSGGSWPVSTDRVVWTVGIIETLKYLPDDQRKKKEIEFLEVLKNTIEKDRAYVYDKQDGLYSGEQSFLDWREQTYPEWTKEDTANIGTSKAISTNVGHYITLKYTSYLAKKHGNHTIATKYETWASDLRNDLNKHFWDAKKGLYKTFKISGLDEVMTSSYDLLGNDLAILFDVASSDQAKKIVSNYPQTKAGPPVIWPQNKNVPIYHNRALWPFVTAFNVLASKKAKNIAAFDNSLRSLVNGSAFNLSNMENLEFTKMLGFMYEENKSGPVVNSRRQLWSVGGYLGSIIRGVFGIELNDEDKLSINPFITNYVQDHTFKNINELTLKNLKIKDKVINFKFVTNKKLNDSDSILTTDFITLNGVKYFSNNISFKDLKRSNEITVKLKISKLPTSSIKLVSTDNWKNLYAPTSPTIKWIDSKGTGLKVSWDHDDFDTANYNIYRNNKLIGTEIKGGNFVDYHANKSLPNCYMLESKFDGYDNYSQHSRVSCYWPKDSIKEVWATDENFSSVAWTSMENKHGYKHFNNWGDPDQQLLVDNISVNKDGRYMLQLVYGNAFNSIATGITACVKRVRVLDEDDNILSEGSFFMPHMASWSIWGDSNFVNVSLKANKKYKVVIYDGFNMSYLKRSKDYYLLGGVHGAINRANILKMKVLRHYNQK